MGRVGKPHGVEGEVYVLPLSDDPARFEPGAELLHDDGRALTVRSSRRHRDRLLVAFDESVTRADAERLRGALYVPPDRLRELDEGEYWEGDLVGCRVALPGGEPVGEVTEVVAGRSQDLLAVSTRAGERLIPLVKEIVTGVDVEARRVTIDPPDGLL